MSVKDIDFTKVLSDKQILDCILDNYGNLGKDWIAHQWNWMNFVYAPFKDHYKYLILISLIEKTLQFYDQVDITYSFDQYYSKSYLQIDKFNIMELCQKINLPKETVRRKVLELEKLGVLKRKKKQIIIDRSAFNRVKPINQIKSTARYVYKIYELLNKKKTYTKELDVNLIEDNLKKNFSLTWRWFYRMQIPMMILYHNVFKDVATFHIWGTVAMNQAFNYKRYIDGSKINNLVSNYMIFNKGVVNNVGSTTGISAMSISDMTSIPRATVVRKCKYLVKHNYLKINDKKQYILTGQNFSKILPHQKEIFKNKSKFFRKVLNLLIIS